MKLLITTQAVDLNDPILGFFHAWIMELSKHFESIVVVCLYEGTHTLPSHVTVVSLGKEKGRVSSLVYAWRFVRHIVHMRRQYDAVFVHMNQEYVLLGGLLWKGLGKQVYMWRNHHAGSLLTDIASFFCEKIFCTSKYSYTAKYRKTVLMPVGIDTNLFSPNKSDVRKKNSILMLGRIAPAKKQHLLVEALTTLSVSGAPFTADIVGDSTKKDAGYVKEIQGKIDIAGLPVNIHTGVPNTKTPPIYRSHDIFVNASSSGMFDKTIFEAMACECLVLVSNKNLEGVLDNRCIFQEGNDKELAEKLQILLSVPEEDRVSLVRAGRALVVESHGLAFLGRKLSQFILDYPQ